MKIPPETNWDEAAHKAEIAAIGEREAEASQWEAAREEYLRRNGCLAPKRWSKKQMRIYFKFACES